MPRRSPLSPEEREVAKDIFLEIHVKPRAWADARDALIERMQARFRYSPDGEAWKRKRRDLETAFTALHRKAVREGWIRRVDGRWRLSEAGLNRLYGATQQPEKSAGPDDHDSRIRTFLHELMRALKPEGYVASPTPWKGLEVADVDEAIELHPLFRDAAYHTRSLKVPEDRNPASLYRRVKRLSGTHRERKRLALERCAKLLIGKHRAWADPKSSTFKAALGALDMVLGEMAAGKTKIPALTQDVGRRQIRLSGFVIFEGDVVKNVSGVKRAWNRAIAAARRRVLKTYRSLRHERERVNDAKERCRISIRELLAYSHYPGLCHFRRSVNFERT